MYRLPDVPGTYTAQLIDSFNTVSWITAADISPSGKSMVLMSYGMMWLFTNYTGSDFFQGKATMLTMDTTQTEGVVFINNTETYLTDERFLGTGGKLYLLDLKQYIDGVNEDPEILFDLNIFPNPSAGKVWASIKVKVRADIQTELVSPMGEVFRRESRRLNPGENQFEISPGGMQRGLYVYRILFGNGNSVTRKIIVR
jgi:hypothetical protein